MVDKSIVLAHYSEKLDWSDNINKDIELNIYSKTNNKYNYYPVNKGNEVNLYLKYIIDRYKELPQKTLFLHAHENSYHQDFPSIEICNNLNWEAADYFNVNRRIYYQEISPNVNKVEYSWIKNNWEQMFGEYLTLPDMVKHYACSQFVVDKTLILQYPVRFYANLLDWINLTYLDNATSGRIFEYTWHYIFTKNPIEKQYNNNEILLNNDTRSNQ